MAPWRCTKRCARSSARPPSFSGAKSTSSATSSTTCRSGQRPWVQAIVRRAYQATYVKTATRLLTDLAKRLEDEYPSAAGSVREGLDETLTVLTLHLSTRLQRSRTRPTTGIRCLRGERRVESLPSRRRVSTAVGTSPAAERYGISRVADTRIDARISISRRGRDTFATFRNITEQVTREIEALENDYVLKASPAELERYYVSQMMVTPLALDAKNQLH